MLKTHKLWNLICLQSNNHFMYTSWDYSNITCLYFKQMIKPSCNFASSISCTTNIYFLKWIILDTMELSHVGREVITFCWRTTSKIPLEHFGGLKHICLLNMWEFINKCLKNMMIDHNLWLFLITECDLYLTAAYVLEITVHQTIVTVTCTVEPRLNCCECG